MLTDAQQAQFQIDRTSAETERLKVLVDLHKHLKDNGSAEQVGMVWAQIVIGASLQPYHPDTRPKRKPGASTKTRT